MIFCDIIYFMGNCLHSFIVRIAAKKPLVFCHTTATWGGHGSSQKGWSQKEKPLSIKMFDCWVMGFVLKTNCKKKPFIVFHFWEFQKQQQEGIAVSPQYWAKAAASKVVEQQASPKISNFPFWFSQNKKTNSILRKGFEIENSLAVMSPLNSHNKGPYKRSFWFQHLCSPTTNKETNNSLSSFF